MTPSICKSEVACKLCRDRERGEVIRRGLIETGKLSLQQLPANDWAFECPVGHPWGYAPARKPEAPNIASSYCGGSGPGSVVKATLASLGFESLPGCGCELMCEQMNGWGWSGCLLHIGDITVFFAGKAKAYGVKASAWTIGRAFVRAFRAGSGGQAGTPVDGISNGGSTAVRG